MSPVAAGSVFTTTPTDTSDVEPASSVCAPADPDVRNRARARFAETASEDAVQVDRDEGRHRAGSRCDADDAGRTRVRSSRDESGADGVRHCIALSDRGRGIL